MSGSMQNRPTGGIEFQLSKGSASGERISSSVVNASQLLYFFLLIPALFIAMMPLGTYPPLDSRLPMGLIICAFLLSAVPRLMTVVQRQGGKDPGIWRTASTCAGLVLPFLGLWLFLNGGLDKSPQSDVKATVIQKIAPIGYREAQYGLVVTSWRPGRTVENLNVSSGVFQRAAVGRTLIVELRQGRFGLTWIENISPE